MMCLMSIGAVVTRAADTFNRVSWAVVAIAGTWYTIRAMMHQEMRRFEDTVRGE